MANTNYIDSFEVNGVEIPVRDPGISQWAREPSAPEYTAEDVGAFPAVPGGSAGQVLTKTADGQEWKTPSGAASYYKTFTAAQWTQTDAEATMSIPRASMGCWAMTFSRKHLSCQAAPIGKAHGQALRPMP